MRIMARWDPWRGCHRCSEGCLHCYIHKGDERRGIDTNEIVKTDKFYAPVERKKNGEYKWDSGKLVYICFSSDFLIEEADSWRPDCFKIIKERQDLRFMFLTKRIERFMDVIPADWGDGYDNVIVGVSVENQEMCDKRLSILSRLPIKEKNIALQPLIAPVNIERYLDGISYVCVGGESDKEPRPFDFDWVLSVREQCVRYNVSFQYRQCGSLYIKDGVTRKVNPFQLFNEARKENLDFWPNGEERMEENE